MPVLALRLSERANAVSELHRTVSRGMWNFLWPNEKEEDVPIGYVTNGVHTGSWLARRMRVLFEKYIGADWLEHLDEPAVWNKVLDIPDDELWETLRHLKNKLVNFANERTVSGWRNGAAHPDAGSGWRRVPRTLLADHWFCATFCHLQARQSCFP